MREDDALFSVARAISERAPVDWNEAESSAADASQRDTLHELRVIAEIAALHRAAAAVPDSDTWGPLTLVEHLAHGSFGDVYRALDRRLDREVALKLLRRPDTASDARGTAAIDEARLLARVRHPNVVTVHGADRINGRVGLWMEFVRGKTLEQILNQRGPLAPDEVAAIGMDVCRALAAVHDAGLLHRDVKAQNVMREDDSDRLVLMDFGAGREALTAESDLTGTPLYLAPEVLRGEPATVQSDLYSVGVLLFHLATGGYPIEGRTLAEIRTAHGERARTTTPAIRPDLPSALAPAISRALESGAANRFESAAAMAEALAHAPHGETRSLRSRRALALAAAVVVAMSIGTAAWFLKPSSEAPGVRTRLVWDEALDYWGTTTADGRYLSFPHWDTGNLAIRDLTSGDIRVITKSGYVANGEVEATAISPDGKLVAFTWVRSDDGAASEGFFELRVIGTDGRGENVLVRGTDLTYVEPFSWSPDSEWIAAVIERSGDRSGIVLVSPDGSRTRTIVTDLTNGPQHVRFAPDGRWLAFDVNTAPMSLERRAVYVVPATGSPMSPVHVAQDATVVGWTPDGRSLLFSRPRNSVRHLYVVPLVDGRVAGEAARIETVNDVGDALGMTHDGALIYGKNQRHTDAVTFSIHPQTGALSPTGEAEPVAAYGRNGLGGVIRYSADGQVLRTPAPESILIRAANGLSRTIVPRLTLITRVEWAADGEALVVAGARDADEEGIYRVDLNSGAATLLVAHPRQGLHALSPDGRTLYYLTPQGPIVARDLGSGHERIVLESPPRPVFDLRVSHDGRTLAVVRLPELQLLDIATGHLTTRYQHQDPVQTKFFGGDWSPDDRHFFTAVSFGSRQSTGEIWSIPIADGPPVRHRMEFPVRGVWVRPDGAELSTMRWHNLLQVWRLENFLPASVPAAAYHAAHDLLLAKSKRGVPEVPPEGFDHVAHVD